MPSHCYTSGYMIKALVPVNVGPLIWKSAACPAEAHEGCFYSLSSALQHQSYTDVTPKFRSSDHHLFNLAL